MFSLIITIIAIALVTLLALATLFYGAEYVKDGKYRTEVAKSLQQGAQIVGAFEVYRANNHGLPTGTEAEIIQHMIDEEYLQQWPHEAWGLRNDYAVKTDMSSEACQRINKNFDIDYIPKCTDAGFHLRTYCCSISDEIPDDLGAGWGEDHAPTPPPLGNEDVPPGETGS